MNNVVIDRGDSGVALRLGQGSIVNAITVSSGDLLLAGVSGSTPTVAFLEVTCGATVVIGSAVTLSQLEVVGNDATIIVEGTVGELYVIGDGSAVSLSAGASGSELTVAGNGIDIALDIAENAAISTLTVIGDEATLEITQAEGSLIEELIIAGDDATLLIDAHEDATIATLEIQGTGLSLAVNEEGESVFETIVVYESFTVLNDVVLTPELVQVADTANITLTDLADIGVVPDEMETFVDERPEPEAPAPTPEPTPAPAPTPAPTPPVILPPGGGGGGGTQDPPPTQQRSWQTVTQGYSNHVINLDNAVALIMVEVPNNATSLLNTGGAASVGQYRFIVRVNEQDTPVTFVRQNIDGVTQYRAAVDLTAFPVGQRAVTVVIQRYQ
jgi:hypothetical protein